MSPRKHIIILGDGMADLPIAELGGKTPLQAAYKPAIDFLAAHGRCGLLHTIPDGFAPGSEIANLSVLGYDLPSVFEGRAVLEAAAMGISLTNNEIAMRCNLICIENNRIKNHSAGHISSEEAGILIQYLNTEIAAHSLHFFPGFSYRHILTMKNGSKNLHCTPPHDVPGVLFEEVMLKPATPEAEETARILNELTRASQRILPCHPVNVRRMKKGKDPANSIWLWSPGKRPKMPTLQQEYGIRNGTVVAAVDLIKGIGIYAGLKVADVPGATGLYNTNYEGKAQAAIEALRTSDFVFLHVEASDEAGHEGDCNLKTRTIEYLDQRIVKPILEETSRWDTPVSIAILPDHPTPCSLRTHTAAPVPFLIYKPNSEADTVDSFDEYAAAKGSYGTLHGDKFMRCFFES